MRMLTPLALLAALLPLPAMAQQEVEDPEIIVIGKALDACIARRCPPAEDARATLRYAETLFLNGKYDKARMALRAAKGRLHARRNEVPAEYADLLRATGTIARHLGEEALFHDSAVQARRVLTENRPASDPLLLAVSLEVGDMYLRTRDPANAENVYRDVAAAARAAGNNVTEAAAMLRLISLASAKDKRFAVANLRAARAVAAEIAARPEPVFRRFDPVAQMMVARMAAAQGDTRALDLAIAAYAKQVGPLVPVIAHATPPRIADSQFDTTGGASVAPMQGVQQEKFSSEALNDVSEGGVQVPRQYFSEQWIDISFWVRPDGRVEEPTIMRRSKRLTGGWEVPVLASVATRRYVPLALDANDPGLLRIERYTFTAPLAKVTGTRILGRSADVRIVMADLSPVAKQP